MKKPKRIYLVVDGEEILYRNKRAYLARTFQNGCGRPSAQVLRTRVEWREPYPANPVAGTT